MDKGRMFKICSRELQITTNMSARGENSRLHGQHHRWAQTTCTTNLIGSRPSEWKLQQCSRSRATARPSICCCNYIYCGRVSGQIRRPRIRTLNMNSMNKPFSMTRTMRCWVGFVYGLMIFSTEPKISDR